MISNVPPPAVTGERSMIDHPLLPPIVRAAKRCAMTYRGSSRHPVARGADERTGSRCESEMR